MRIVITPLVETWPFNTAVTPPQPPLYFHLMKVSVKEVEFSPPNGKWSYSIVVGHVNFFS
jgi:hypothetical protein